MRRKEIPGFRWIESHLRAELPRHTESYSWSSGLVSGAGDLTMKGTGHQLAAADLVFVPEAQWLRINFSSGRAKCLLEPS